MLNMHVLLLSIPTVNVTFMIYKIYLALITEVHLRDL